MINWTLSQLIKIWQLVNNFPLQVTAS
jgi:hypothetical protein